MSKPTHVLSPAGDYEEAIERYAKHLGKDRIRRRVFNEIYGRVKKFRSKKEILAALEMDASKGQQVQNALEHLYRHQLIGREENNGRTSDGSKFVYGRAEFIRGNKAKIVQYADNPKLAERVPTKRRSTVRQSRPLRTINKKTLASKKHLNVLYLTADSDNEHRLRVDAEVRGVQEAIRGSKFRDNINLEFRPSADLKSLIDGLNDKRPQLVHFSGHGNAEVVLTDGGDPAGAAPKDLSLTLFAKALNSTDTPPDIVVLNSCNSSGAQDDVVPPAKVLISMRDSISDIAANAFAVQFYAGLASGQSVKAAYDQGCVAVESVSIDEFDTPQLITDASTDAASLVLV